jgi:hypothetical protein
MSLMKRLIKNIHPSLQENGVAGLVEYVESPRRGFFTKLLVVIDRYFPGVLPAGRAWVNFESQVGERGPGVMTREFIEYLGLDMQINNLIDALVEPGRPTILMGLNHEAVIEPVIFVALCQRPDFRLIGIKTFQYLGTTVASRVYPVLPRKFGIDYQGNTKANLTNRWDPIYQLYALEGLTVAEIEALNEEALNHAAEYVSNGGALIIFPTGGKSIENGWYAGLGEILGRMSPDTQPMTQIFPITITGLTRGKLFKKSRQALKGKQQPSPFQVQIDEPIRLPTDSAQLSSNELLNHVRSTVLDRLQESREPESFSSYADQIGRNRTPTLPAAAHREPEQRPKAIN